MIEERQSFAEIWSFSKEFVFLWEVNKMWRKAKKFLAFLGNDEERENYQHCQTVWRLFFSKTVAAVYSKPFLVTDIIEISNEAKDT